MRRSASLHGVARHASVFVSRRGGAHKIYVTSEEKTIDYVAFVSKLRCSLFEVLQQVAHKSDHQPRCAEFNIDEMPQVSPKQKRFGVQSGWMPHVTDEYQKRLAGDMVTVTRMDEWILTTETTANLHRRAPKQTISPTKGDVRRLCARLVVSPLSDGNGRSRCMKPDRRRVKGGYRQLGIGWRGREGSESGGIRSELQEHYPRPSRARQIRKNGRPHSWTELRPPCERPRSWTLSASPPSRFTVAFHMGQMIFKL